MTINLADYSPSAAAWRRLAPGLLLMAAALALFRDTAVAMVTIWNRSDTFAHAFLVPPIVVWLAWRRRATLATLPLRPAPWVLLPMLAVCALWLLGELASVNAATQFALVALLVLAVPAVFGLAVARALTFPLLFLFFAVPVGEFMVPTMMDWTADFAATAVRLSGVPIYREGLQFVIPSGNWSVVEACSGVRYLIASFMVGTLFAYLNFQSPLRRAVFMGASLLVPIVANWVRAYLIVMIGHYSDNKLAAGVDHIIYGWVFFGIVIAGMFMVGSRWAEPDPAVPDAQRPLASPAGRASGTSVWAVGGLALLLLVGTQAVVRRIDGPHAGAAQVALTLPATAALGWAATAEPVSLWTPNFANAVLNVSRSYRADNSRTVGVWVAYYRDLGPERKLVTSTNTLVEQENGSAWAQTASGSTSLALASGPLGLRTAILRGSVEPGSPTAQWLRVWQLYWVGGHYTTSDARARLQLAFNRLLGRGDDGAALFFYTPIESASGAAAADKVLGDFVAAELPALERSLVAASQQR